MEGRKKPTPALIIAVIFCAIGCLLFAGTAFIETELNLFMFGMVFNGIGLGAFLYSMRPAKVEE